MNNPERTQPNPESTAETQLAAGERSEQLKDKLERSVEQSSETKSEQLSSARKEAKEIFAKEPGKERISNDPTSSPQAIRRVSKAEKKISYAQTLQHIRSEMSAPSRTFSTIIHTPFVEKTSEVLGSSLARPNAILAGSFTAFVLVTLLYVVARTYGYQLSGFETIATFVLGWILGILYDYVQVMITGKR